MCVWTHLFEISAVVQFTFWFYCFIKSINAETMHCKWMTRNRNELKILMESNYWKLTNNKSCLECLSMAKWCSVQTDSNKISYFNLSVWVKFRFAFAFSSIHHCIECKMRIIRCLSSVFRWHMSIGKKHKKWFDNLISSHSTNFRLPVYNKGNM